VRKSKLAGLVAARIEKRKRNLPEEKQFEGVTPLNPGYFEMERIRLHAPPKARSAVRARLRSPR
jgi:hypothetical protein